jgi:hypothetical protein
MLVAIYLLFLSAPVAAQIYKYTDKDGVIHVTNDLMKVPKDQRDHVEKIDEIKSSPPAKPTTPPKTKPIRKKSPSNPAKTNQAEAKINETEVKKQIEQKKKELEDEYKTLMEEKAQIDIDTKNWQKRYNTRRRKSVARGKLKALKVQEAEWQEKFEAFEQKKNDLQLLENNLIKDKKGKESVLLK